MSMKWSKKILEVLDTKEYKSTRKIMKELRENSGTVVNWRTTDNTLKELESFNMVEKIDLGQSTGWRKVKK